VRIFCRFASGETAYGKRPCWSNSPSGYDRSSVHGSTCLDGGGIDHLWLGWFWSDSNGVPVVFVFRFLRLLTSFSACPGQCLVQLGLRSMHRL
jgi:hypothetical protein